MEETKKVRLALGILSGRIKRLDQFQYLTLGYDTYKFSSFGQPDSDEIKQEAENIIYEYFNREGVDP